MNEPVAFAVWERGGDLRGYVATESEGLEAIRMAELADQQDYGIEASDRYELVPVVARSPDELLGTRVWESGRELTELEVRVRDILEQGRTHIDHAREHPEDRVARVRRDVAITAPLAEDDTVDVSVTLHDMRPRHARLLLAAVDASTRSLPAGPDDLLIALIALACWLDGPDSTRPDQSFAQQFRRAIPGEAWNQWLPIERDLTTIPAMERVLREAEADP
jgi:hypothetical protein